MNRPITSDSDEDFTSPALLLLLLETDAAKNEQAMEILSAHILAQNPGNENPARASEFIKRLRSAHSTHAHTLRWLIGIVLLFALAVLCWWLWPQQKQVAVYIAPAPAVSPGNSGTPAHTSRMAGGAWRPQHTPQAITPLHTDSAEDESTNPPNPPVAVHTAPSRWMMPQDANYFEEEIPVLTDAQIKQTAKDKLKIMREVSSKRSTYVTIPAGSTSVNNTRVSLKSFNIKGAEVTNFEYRTFLHDLLVQHRTDDYLAAKPVSNGWTKAGVPEYEAVYFSSPAYNEFPAVNMSRKGAELFCEWMTSEFRKAVASGKIKWNKGIKPQFRLPNESEWIYAARASSTNATYPWSSVIDNVQNQRGCYLCNFNYTLSKPDLRPEGPSTGKTPCISTKPNPHSIITTAGRALDTLLMAPVYAYNPNAFALYCTSGNAAEMVWAPQPNGQPAVAKAMGGAWSSHASQMKIENTERFEGVVDGNAAVGFRPVLVWEVVAGSGQ
ncbi:MAG: formylglycine-generating enzyme family protein [Bacteroidia bacterium]|jgi:formylglycine-generating enzyme required for sulfatase activity|nr:formylglycine-generating enzyme family protein [Bacteroidia bacterium]